MQEANFSQTQPQTTHSQLSYISKLTLTNFRNYTHHSLNLQPSPIVLTGPNGIGKTNILEAISFLSPGKGLRKIKLHEADRIDNDKMHPWSITSIIINGDQQIKIGTAHNDNNNSNKRILKIDEELIKGQAQLANICSIMWLTPQMDGLFLGSSSDRRRFLDRLVYNFDPEHASRIYSYEYTMRERAKLLQNRGDDKWLTILENKLAEKSVSIAAARIDAVNTIQSAIYQSTTAFPQAIINVEGAVETMLKTQSALQSEENLRQQLHDSRTQDYHTGRTNIGTHRSDLNVHHKQKNMPAASCSTGEQKALLLSIILAEAYAKSMWKGSIPIILLDEVVAHLDQTRRQSLFDEIITRKAQTWMTGTDISLFQELQGRGQFLQMG